MSTGADLWASATEVVIATDGSTYTSDPTDNASLTFNTGADAGEVTPTAYSSSKSAWWKYTPSSSGTATFSTENTTTGPGGSQDTEMAIYTGSSIGTLSKLASNSDTVGTRAKISGFSVTSGTTYYIQVAAYNGFPMNYVLDVTGPASAMTSITGTFTAPLPALTASFAGDAAAATITGTLAGTLPALTASLSGAVDDPSDDVTGTLTGVLPGLVATFTGEGDDDSQEYAPTLPDPVAPSFVGTRRPLVSVATSLPAPVLVDGRPT